MRLADRLAYGAGCAARRVGFLHDAYRPDGPEAPVDLAKRFLRLCVAFVLPGGSVAAPSGFGVPFRQAWADWSYLQAGDYLAGPEGTAFVATIEPPKPMLVVMTNTVVKSRTAGTSCSRRVKSVWCGAAWNADHLDRRVSGEPAGGWHW